MYKLLFWQFLRTKTCQLGVLLLLILGGIGLMVGKQFLTDQQKQAGQVVETQANHITRNVDLHADDLPLLLYYLKFSLIDTTHSMAGFAIGQKDVNPSVKRVTMLTLEGQKHDADLVNPVKLMYGNIDLSFVFIHVLPLLIIAFTYNLYSEEEESGTWKMVNVMAKSKAGFLITKLSVRFILLSSLVVILFLAGIVVFDIALNSSSILFLVIEILYLIFWFALCFCVVCLKRSSNFNALALLSTWLILVVLMPAFINNYITTKYPVPEALTTMIQQRDGYHNKWDTNKRETLEAFYKEYPQFIKNGFPSEDGFDWWWYYAMQHLGDVESREISETMRNKILLREEMSRKLAMFIPSIHAQLSFTDIAKTGLTDYMSFLSYTNKFHEDIRLYFYPMIFSNTTVASVDWKKFEPSYFSTQQSVNWSEKIMPLSIAILVLISLSTILIKKRIN